MARGRGAKGGTWGVDSICFGLAPASATRSATWWRQRSRSAATSTPCIRCATTSISMSVRSSRPRPESRTWSTSSTTTWPRSAQAPASAARSGTSAKRPSAGSNAASECAGMTKLERISNAIIEAIESGALREGHRPPAEEELAVEQGVSVGSMQKALARLAHVGLIRREHGRGTFISGHKVAPADGRHLRFLDEQGHPLTSYVHAHGVKRMKRKGPWSDFLEGQALVRVDRTINIGGKFDLSSEFWLREEDFDKPCGVGWPCPRCGWINGSALRRPRRLRSARSVWTRKSRAF